jgi:hypothetical protein
MTDPRTEALAAYYRFFEGFNSRTPESWAAGLNFPHVRVSPNGTPSIVPSAAAHARNMSWEAVQASGWDHSVGAQPTVLHVSADCVHVIGGWSRYTRDNKLIMTNHVTYVITRMQVDGRDHWGMQSRFGADPGPGGLTDVHAEIAVGTAERFVAGWLAGKADTGAANLPFIRVVPGQATRLDDAAALVEHLRTRPAAGAQPAPRGRSVQAGPRAVNVAFGSDDAPGLRALLLVTSRDGHWGVQAMSVLA